MSTHAATATKSVPDVRRRRRFAAMTVLISLLPFVLLELVLRLFGSAAPPSDLHDGFGSTIPLFTLDEDAGVYRTSLPRQRFFAQQQFAEHKPSNEFRIFCLGGSTVQGRPFAPDTAFPKWLELELQAVSPDTSYHTINCGGVSYASYRLTAVLREVLNYQPDLILLATGHNEFLEDQTYANLKQRSPLRMKMESAARSIRTVMLLRSLTGGAAHVEPTGDSSPTQSVQAKLDSDAGYASYHRDDVWQRQVGQNYATSVRDMFKMCRQADVPIVAVALGANLRDCPPFKSQHSENLAADEQQRWQQMFDRATELDRTDAADALRIYRQAQRIDDRFALLHFRIARCLDRLQQFDDAAAAYRQALVEDICPLRMMPSVKNELIVAAADFDVPVVDAERALAVHCSHQIPSFEAYLDHVHPTMGGHQIISTAVSDALRAAGVITLQRSLSSDARRQLFAQHLEELGSTYIANGRRRIGWLEGWARRNRLQEEVTPIDARGYMAATLRYAELNDFEPATDHLLMAVVTDSAASAGLLHKSARLFNQGLVNQATWILKELRIAGIDASTEASIDLANLVTIVTKADLSALRQKLRERDDWERLIKTDTTGWAAVIPDLRDRLQAIRVRDD